MKKIGFIILTLLLVVGLMAVDQEETQPLRFAFGVRGGIVSSSYSYDVATGNPFTVVPSAKQALVLAGIFEYAFSDALSVGVELATLAKNATFSATLTRTNKTFELENTKNFLELSIYGKYHLSLDEANKSRIYALLGFFYGSKSSGTRQYIHLGATDVVTTEDDTPQYWGDIDAGLIGGVGFDYRLSPSFSLLADIRYTLGTRELQGNMVDDIIKSQGFQFSLGGLFRF